MDYYEIGRKIRKHRKKAGMSQEQLAEAVNISVTHMSHIETGNTKLSLPVLVDIANVLQVTTDELLLNINHAEDNGAAALINLLSGCTAKQIKLITEVAKTIKNSTDSVL